MKREEFNSRFSKSFYATVIVVVLVALVSAGFKFQKEGEELFHPPSVEKKIGELIDREFGAYKETFQNAVVKDEEIKGEDAAANFRPSAGGEAVFDVSLTPRNLQIEPPKNIKGIYLTAHSVLSPAIQKQVFDLVEATDLNSIVVNVKDGEGIFQGPTMREFVVNAKERGIWTIARIVVMQDNSLAALRPDLALRTPEGEVWKDTIGLHWVDPASKEVWDYNVKTSQEIIDMGFDELNFDYVRFPSDGLVETIRYPFWSGVTAKHGIMKQFFAYLTSELKKYKPDIILSVDLFAYNLLSSITLDSVVGQHVEDAALYFDVIAPMVYPSHYLPGNFGFQNPAEYPYEVVRGTLEQGIAKVLKARDKAVIRPWLQAFDMGAAYDRAMIDLERKAVKDVGLEYGWMLWNPNNIYLYQWFNP